MTVPPLDGIVVADFSRVLAGPLATMTLADLGARVIKVERPGTGDDTRSWGPPFSAHAATYFEGVNRNKESIALDLKDPDDRKIARRLAGRSDVVIENFLPGTMEQHGLGYEQVAAANPGVVYVSISGFGSGAGAALPGYDFVVQALGGLMHVTGEPHGAPMKVGVALVDVLTGKDAVIGILAAIRRRAISGEGARLELSLLSSLQGALANQAAAYLGAGASPGRMGNVHPSIAPYELLECADAPLAVACGNDRQFAKLAAELGSPDLATDPRFATNPQRVVNRQDLRASLEHRLRERPAAQWQERLNRIGVPAGQVNDIAGGLAFAAELGLEPTVEVHGSDGTSYGQQVRQPISFTPHFDAPHQAAPRLDEHRTQVLRWLESPA